MKMETLQALYEDYQDYQEWYYQNHDWIMKETFVEYVQRCIDMGELDLIEVNE
jgi:hypothetical protein